MKVKQPTNKELQSEIREMFLFMKEQFEGVHGEMSRMATKKDLEDLRNELLHEFDTFTVGVRRETDPVRRRLRHVEDYLRSKDREFKPSN